jgi:threonine dehydrogenase-like Zn-dependent dehydrogenase
MSKTNVVLSIPEPGKFELVEKPYPKIKAGYAIIRTEIAPICLEGTRIWARHDFEIFEGGAQSDYPDALGHEGVGVVEDVHPGSSFKKGDRVIVFQGDHCGVCHSCREGLAPPYCEANIHARPGMKEGRVAMAGIQDWNGSESGGWAMARYRIAPVQNMYKIPDALDFKHAAVSNCSFGTGWSAQEIMGVKAGDTVLVAGVGFITMGHIISALFRNATVIALMRNTYREALIREMGVQHVINPEDPDWLEKVREITYEGQGVDHAIDGSGAAYYQEKLFAAGRLYAKINFSGHIPGEALRISPLEHILNPGHTFFGQHDVRARDREGLVRALLNQDVQRMIDVMVTHEFPMSQAGEAFDVQVSKKCGKIFLYTQK